MRRVVGQRGRADAKTGTMFGEIDQQLAVRTGRDVALQHASVAIQLDGETQPPQHPPCGDIPRDEHDRETAERQHERIARAEVLHFMIDHEPLLIGVAAEKPARNDDLRPREPDDSRSGRG